MSGRKSKRMLPIAPVDRLIRAAGGGDVKVTRGAVFTLVEILEQIGVEIGTIAKDFMRHAGRKSINGEDIKLAFNQWKEK